MERQYGEPVRGVRISDAEWRLIQRAAKVAGETASGFVRMAAVLSAKRRLKAKGEK